MKKTLAVFLSIILFSSCASRRADLPEQTKEATQETAQAAADNTSDEELPFWFSDNGEESYTAKTAPVEKIYSAAVETFQGVLDTGVENLKIKLSL